MTDFNAQYVQANVSETAAPYDSTKFLDWRKRIGHVLDTSARDISLGVLVAILVAQQRGDLVGPLLGDFSAAATGRNKNMSVKEAFSVVREAITISAPFVGLPNTMPACFGAIAVLKARGVDIIEFQPRPTFQEADYVALGKDTNARIYRGVGNAEVGQMIARYLPDLSFWANASIFGYLCGGSVALSLEHVELIVVSAIIGLGATRQARSHCKAAMQLGISPKLLEKIVTVATDIASWNERPLPAELDITNLLDELNKNLAKIDASAVWVAEKPQ